MISYVCDQKNVSINIGRILNVYGGKCFFSSRKRTAVNRMSHLIQSVTSQRPSSTSDSANKKWVTSAHFRLFSRNSTIDIRKRVADFLFQMLTVLQQMLHELENILLTLTN
jgi:hypothetical protein